MTGSRAPSKLGPWFFDLDKQVDGRVAQAFGGNDIASTEKYSAASCSVYCSMHFGLADYMKHTA